MESSSSQKKLIEAARDLFARHGFAGVSVDDVAAKVGLTKGAVYYQFKDKNGLFAAACRLVVSEIISIVTDTTMHHVDHHIDELLTGSEQLFLLYQREDARQLLLQDGPAVLGPHAWTQLVAPLRFELAQHAIQHIADAGLLAQDLVAPMADVVTGAFNEAVLAVMRAEGDGVAADRAKQAYQLLIAGLLRHAQEIKA